MRLAEQPRQLLESLAREELGLSEQTFPGDSPAALSATLSTAIDSAVPVLQFLIASGATALIISFAISTVANFLVGDSKLLVTGGSWLKNGMEMMLIGIAEAALTYSIWLLVAPYLV